MAAAAAENHAEDGPEAEPVTFTNAAGLRLAGTFTRADAAPGARCVILCHGYAGTQDDMRLPDIAEACAAAGLNSLRFDFRGNGASEGTFRFAGFDGEVEDITAAKAFLERELRQRVVGLLGHSKGGDVVLLYSARHGDISRVVNVAGRFVMTEGIKERFGADIIARLEAGPVQVLANHPKRGAVRLTLTLEDVRERMAVDIAAACAAIASGARVSLLTVHGAGDRTIPPRDARLVAAAVPGSELRVVEAPGADHNFTGEPAGGELVAAAVEFLGRG
ncbi:hypothetical protein Rsub_05628 [Raphidocelis subcapitata]|uniref:Serine aminopeptidase S33 domain-containing protein n=1 Tax=Raphidocelis subcapitata TaxID=307507 RepID=A0A2V0P747_9CHLO|nr:hypothetical protein Rsub_05628 [Raphidocelis subcapitata]|eukprot:GBF93017.1 hypothetical protein Rsub_05628 [Raphidocelis subcapitata]